MNLDRRAAGFINPDRGVTSAADAAVGRGAYPGRGPGDEPTCAAAQILNRTADWSSAGPKRTTRLPRGFAIISGPAKRWSASPQHRVLAINRGEGQVLRENRRRRLRRPCRRRSTTWSAARSIHTPISCAAAAATRLLAAGVSELGARCARADRWSRRSHAVEVFARNLHMLLQKPVHGGACWRSIPSSRAAWSPAARRVWESCRLRAVIGQQSSTGSKARRLIKVIPPASLGAIAATALPAAKPRS